MNTETQTDHFSTAHCYAVAGAAIVLAAKGVKVRNLYLLPGHPFAGLIEIDPRPDAAGIALRAGRCAAKSIEPASVANVDFLIARQPRKYTARLMEAGSIDNDRSVRDPRFVPVSAANQQLDAEIPTQIAAIVSRNLPQIRRLGDQLHNHRCLYGPSTPYQVALDAASGIADQTGDEHPGANDDDVVDDGAPRGSVYGQLVAKITSAMHTIGGKIVANALANLGDDMLGQLPEQMDDAMSSGSSPPEQFDVQRAIMAQLVGKRLTEAGFPPASQIPDNQNVNEIR